MKPTTGIHASAAATRAAPATRSAVPPLVPPRRSAPRTITAAPNAPARPPPARRMESLLAHIARKERDTLRVKKVDVDERPDLARRFRIAQVPSLALVKGRRVVARLEGRSTAPKIESLLDSHVRENETESHAA